MEVMRSVASISVATCTAGVDLHDFVRNADIHRTTNQPPLSSIIKSRCLTLFGHLARMDENADASQAIFEPPENWRRPPVRPRTTWMKNIHDDLSSLDLGIHEARDLAQNRPFWRLMSLHSATHSWTCIAQIFRNPDVLDALVMRKQVRFK